MEHGTLWLMVNGDNTVSSVQMDEDWITIQHVHILTGMTAEKRKRKRQKRAVTILREVLARGREDGCQHSGRFDLGEGHSDSAHP